MMMGETVTVLTRSQTGADGFGDKVWAWTAEEVPNCLVRPLSGSDVDLGERPDGIKAQYTVAFPKAYSGNLARARVVLSDRVGAVTDPAASAETALRVSGAPDVTRPCPTLWNMTVTVGIVDG